MYILIASTVLYNRRGKYTGSVNLLRKYLGDFLIASYLDVIQESGYDDTYIQDIEVTVLSVDYIFFHIDVRLNAFP